MKMNRFFCLGLVLICCSNSAFGMAADKAFRMYNRARAKQFLQSLSVEKPSCELNRNQLTQYLNSRVINAEKIMRGNKLPLRSELWVLDPQLALAATRDELETNPNARAVCFYPKMTRENLRLMLLNRLKCSAGDLMGSETPYEDAFEQITVDEFKARLEALPAGEVLKMLLQTSHHFAMAILAVNVRAKY